MSRRLIVPVCLLALFVAHRTCFGASGLPFKEIHRFIGSLPSPSGAIWGTDGALYGTCYQNGDHNLGYVYRATTNGSLVALISFTATNGAYPMGKLALGHDGLLYGTTTKGGPSNKGTIFRISTNGVFEMIAAFTGTNGPNFGEQPLGLCLGQDGTFYGCTRLGGKGTTLGTAFRITPGGNFTSLANFSPSQHGFPVSGSLVEGPDGAFYGTTRSEGPANQGAIFRLTSSVALSVSTCLDVKETLRVCPFPGCQMSPIKFNALPLLAAPGRISFKSRLTGMETEIFQTRPLLPPTPSIGSE